MFRERERERQANQMAREATFRQCASLGKGLENGFILGNDLWSKS